MIKPISIISSNYPIFVGRNNSRIRYDNYTPTYDTFTGLKDKNCLLADLGKKMYRKEDISIGMFDMDNFKSINELLGYKIGDEFIKAISEDISNVAKKHEVDAYRFGGDEFVVLLFNGMDKDEKMKVVDDVVKTISTNPIIQAHSEDYMHNATIRLQKYEESSNKIKKLLSLITQRNILYDIYNHSTIAKEDPYIQERLIETDIALNSAYETLISECLLTERDAETRKSLKSKNTDQLNEYFINKYDRSHELYRLKKWIKDFNKNGFNITGGIATFKPSYYKGKQPIDLINEVGEHLKDSKGEESYYVEID